ncbi:succinylglutamate desuccinylase/aspartoacylase family protein [Natronosalvus vescus]|uniref:succinylglutamate desuccinylase/aspartoacylase family protein n=1 Tax=Natronosalvus vescus TaxID=2953881 RepID=UPI002090CF58|nr:succinylglutamate desuccinylase/aspartoacylase family protein [Natronosalvus vescus]
MTTTLGTASASPGEIDTGRLEVGETRDGSPFSLPVAVVNGAEPGQTLYMQAASDGDELNGVGVLNHVVPQLDPAALSGTILLVGIVNYHAFQVAEHRNPIDDTKMNRTYPGNESGTSSERIAHETFQVARRADLILDLHQGSTSRMIDEVRIRCGKRHRLHDACLELAQAFGVECGHILDQKGPEGQLARAAPGEGIPTVDPELGGAVGWNESSIRKGVAGVFNVLRHYDFLEGDAEFTRQTRATGFEQYGAPAGGLVRFGPDLGDRVTAGETLFTITSPFGEPKATVTADTDGIFWRTRRLPQVATGEYVCSVGTDIDTITHA